MVKVFTAMALMATASAAPQTSPDGGRLELRQAIELALTQARGVVVARSNVLIADKNRARALAALLPSFTVLLGAYEDFQGQQILEVRPPMFCSESFNPEGCSTTTDFELPAFVDQRQINNSNAARFDLRLVARQLIWDGGRSWSFLQRDSIARDRSRDLLRIVENNVRLDVVRRFYGLARAEQTTIAFEQRVALDEAQLARARARSLENKGSEADVAAAERNLAQDRLTLAQRRFSEDGARRLLNLSMGRSADVALKLVIPAPLLRAQDTVTADQLPALADLTERAKSHRPDLASGRRLQKMAERNVNAALALRQPSVFLSGQYRRTSRRPDRVFADPTSNYTAFLGLDIRWNVFSGLRDEAGIDVAALQSVNARTNYEDQERRVLSEVIDRRQNLEIQIEVYRLARAALRPAEDTVRLSRQRKEQGEATTLELRDAELRFTQAQLAAINARLQIEIAREELRRAVGTDI